jgi:hypothetical protein
MRDIYIGNGTIEYHLHSTTEWLPTYVQRGLAGLEGPEMRIDVYDNPGVRGQTVAQLLPGGSLISLDGVLRTRHMSNDAEEYATYLSERQRMAAALTHTYNDLGRVQPLLLRFTDLSGRALQTEVYRDRYRAPHELPTRNEWMLQLRNPSGVLESQSTKSVSLGLQQQGGVVFDLVWDIVFGDSTGGFVTATNEGTTEAKPTVKLHGPLVNPVLTNTATGEFIGLNHTLLAGDIMTIETKTHLIYQGESTNRMGTRKAGSVLWSLQPGANTLSLTADTFDTGFAEISWRDTWGGV